MTGTETRKRIQGVDCLRGLAALAVCWFHLTEDALISNPVLRASGHYGPLGVEVFFVISGFIIPYSLHRAGYRLGSYPTFILKRITRLDPPYVVSILLVLSVAFVLTLSPGYRGEGFHVNFVGLLLHLGYLNVLFGYPWLNPVYWTLAIEFQYYLMMGLLFPLVSSARRPVRLLTFAVLGLTPLAVTSGKFIFPFIYLFMMGMATFQYRAGTTGRREYLVLIVLFAAGTLWALGVPYTLAGLFGVAGIAFFNIRNSVLNFLGNISYSLYLVHPPVCRLTYTVARRFVTGDAAQVGALLVALAASLVGAYLLYLYVEKPAQEWSSSFSYRRRTAPAAAATAAATGVGEAGADKLAAPLAGAEK